MALTQVKTTGLADDAVTGAKIADDTVAEANMANDAISLAELKAGTDGQIITYDASGNPTAVGPGNDGQVLTSTGAGSPPAFEDLPASGPSLANDANNRVITGTGSGLNGEANLTFDGSQLLVGGTQMSSSSERPLQVQNVDGPKIAIGRNDTSISEGNTIGGIEFYGNDANGTYVNTAGIIVDADGTHGDNDKPTRMEFYTTSDGGSSVSERLRIDSTGDVKITDGDLVIGTSGHGIDFSATSGPTNGSGTSELLDDYEEGTFTPTIYGNSSAGTTTYHGSDNRRGHYTKIGNQVTAHYQVGWTENTGSGTLQIGGLPYTIDATSYGNPNGTHQAFGSVYMDFVAAPIDSGSFLHLVGYVYGGAGTAIRFLQMQISGGSQVVDMTYGANESSSVIKYIAGTITYQIA